MNIIVNDIAVNYESGGDGPAVLLLHGWGDDLRTFDALASDLIDAGNRVVRLDLPGFGKSELPSGALGKGWSVADYATFVRAFLDKLGNAQLAVLVGHSFGGRIAIKGVADGLFSPKQLVLFASAGIREETMRGTTIGALGALAKAVTAIWPLSYARGPLMRHFASRDYLAAGPLKETFKKVVGEDLTADAQKITVPTLLVWGDNDTETPVSQAHVLHESIRNSQLKVFPNAGHFVHHEKPAEVSRLVQTFLQS